MITLFLDTSATRLIVGIYKDNTPVLLVNEKSMNDLSSRLLPTIKGALDELKMGVKDINRIIVVNGPGSFTGVRVGVTVAKTLAWAKNIPIIPVSELELLATTKVETNYVVPFIDARRDAFYAGMYDKKHKNIIEDTYITRTSLLNKIKRHVSLKDVTFVSYDKVEGLESILPKLNIEYIIKKYARKKSFNPHSVNPNYLKKVEAEEKLNDKRNK